MILDSPAFAATLWEKALEGKCKLYADGYRYLKFTPRYDSSFKAI
jgi:pumilio family protein 6